MNNNAKELEELENNTETRESCGTVLSRARMEQQRTIEEISGKLNLSVSQIKAIELDKIDGLPEPTYVRGYIRSYAKLLKLDPDEVLEYYGSPDWNQKANNWVDVPGDISKGGELKKKKPLSKKRIVLLALLLLAFLLYKGIIPNPFLVDDKELKHVETVMETAVEPANEAEPVTSNMPVVKQGNVEASSEKSINQLKLRFSDTSWVDIRDADNKRLTYKTFLAGDELEVSSESAMSVYLGTAAGVTVEYNNQALDIVQYQNGVYAKFTVGE